MSAARFHLVELSRPEAGWRELEALSAKARAAADEARSDGIPVRFLRSIFEPESGSCFLLFQAPSAHDAGLAAARANLAFKGIAGIETVAHPEDAERHNGTEEEQCL